MILFNPAIKARIASWLQTISFMVSMVSLFAAIFYAGWLLSMRFIGQ